eukprot:1157272-Pelagomonas_calceolata.AAC.1
MIRCEEVDNPYDAVGNVKCRVRHAPLDEGGSGIERASCALCYQRTRNIISLAACALTQVHQHSFASFPNRILGAFANSDFTSWTAWQAACTLHSMKNYTSKQCLTHFAKSHHDSNIMDGMAPCFQGY